MASGCHEATGASRRRSSWRRRRSSGPSGTAGSFVCVVRGRPRDCAPRIRRARHSSPRWRSRACGHRRLLDREPGRPRPGGPSWAGAAVARLFSPLGARRL